MNKYPNSYTGRYCEYIHNSYRNSSCYADIIARSQYFRSLDCSARVQSSYGMWMYGYKEETGSSRRPLPRAYRVLTPEEEQQLAERDLKNKIVNLEDIIRDLLKDVAITGRNDLEDRIMDFRELLRKYRNKYERLYPQPPQQAFAKSKEIPVIIKREQEEPFVEQNSGDSGIEKSPSDLSSPSTSNTEGKKFTSTARIEFPLVRELRADEARKRTQRTTVPVKDTVSLQNFNQPPKERTPSLAFRPEEKKFVSTATIELRSKEKPILTDVRPSHSKTFQKRSVNQQQNGKETPCVSQGNVLDKYLPPQNFEQQLQNSQNNLFQRQDESLTSVSSLFNSTNTYFQSLDNRFLLTSVNEPSNLFQRQPSASLTSSLSNSYTQRKKTSLIPKNLFDDFYVTERNARLEVETEERKSNIEKLKTEIQKAIEFIADHEQHSDFSLEDTNYSVTTQLIRYYQDFLEAEQQGNLTDEQLRTSLQSFLSSLRYISDIAELNDQAKQVLRRILSSTDDSESSPIQKLCSHIQQQQRRVEKEVQRCFVQKENNGDDSIERGLQTYFLENLKRSLEGLIEYYENIQKNNELRQTTNSLTQRSDSTKQRITLEQRKQQYINRLQRLNRRIQNKLDFMITYFHENHRQSFLSRYYNNDKIKLLGNTEKELKETISDFGTKSLSEVQQITAEWKQRLEEEFKKLVRIQRIQKLDNTILRTLDAVSEYERLHQRTSKDEAKASLAQYLKEIQPQILDVIEEIKSDSDRRDEQLAASLENNVAEVKHILKNYTSRV